MLKQSLENAKRFVMKSLRKTKTGGKWKPGKERYSVIIASETDARKQTYGFCITRKAVAAAAAAAALVVATLAILTLASVFRASQYSAKASELKSRIMTQSSLADTYEAEIGNLGAELSDLRKNMQPAGANE